MSRSFDQPTGPNYAITGVGSALGSLGNGAHTVICLFQTTSAGGGNAGIISFRSASGITVQIIVDTGQLFGAGDFNGGQTGITAGTWYWAAIRKAAGTNVYRFSLRQYNTGSATHQNTAGTHADTGATNTSVRLGDGDNRGNGLIAVWAAWTSNLSDSAVAGMFTTSAADIAAQSPQGLWLGNQSALTDPIPDSTGNGAGSTSFVGTTAIGIGADPPGYSYALGASAVWVPGMQPRRRTQPPRKRPRIATPVRSQVNPPFPFTGIEQPRRIRGLLLRRPRAVTPIRAQVNPPFPIGAMKQPREARGFLPRRPRAVMPVPPQVVVAASTLVPRPVREQVRGVRWFRARAAAPPLDRPVPPATGWRIRLRGLRQSRARVAGPTPPQVLLPPAYPPQPVRPKLRGLRQFRAHLAAPPVDQLDAGQAQRPRLRPARAFRGRTAGPVPAQVSLVPPAYPPAPVRTRLRGLRLFRARSAGPVPAQITFVSVAYVMQSVRSKVRGLRLFRGRAAAPVPPQVAVASPPRPPGTVRTRVKGLRRGRGRIAAAPVAQAVPLAAPHGRPHPLAPRRGHAAMPPPPQVAVVPPPYPPTLTRAKKRLARIFRGAARFAGWPTVPPPPAGTSSPTPEIVSRSSARSLTSGSSSRNLTSRTESRNQVSRTTSRDLEA